MKQNTAKAAVFTAPGKPFEIKEYPLAAAPAGMAKIRMLASGVCGTDLHIFRGRLGAATPAIIGHELVGEIEELSAGSKNFQVGDRVIVDIACPCGECMLCKAGDDANCVHLGVSNAGNPDDAPHFWGGYAQYNYSPLQNLIKIPDGIDSEIVCAYACAGPTAIHSFELGKKAGWKAEETHTAVVQGAGALGSFAVAYLACAGVKNVIAVIGRENEHKTQMLRSLGASEVYSMKKDGQKIQHRISEITEGIGADLVFEGSGGSEAIPFGMDLLRNRGMYLVPGQYSDKGGVVIQPQMITFKALQIIGSSQYSVCDVEKYLRFLSCNQHLWKVIGGLISKYSLEDINLAFEDMEAGKNIKTVLVGK
ncbi:MAG: alcohol dehydrogenase catalytic domain-containing protein [Clostridiales bacterium]|nr:alcohol dehydrogenase catalytic domain-containing protein [Clostridiales bacterium]